MLKLIDADALIEKYTVVIRKTADEKLKTEIAVLLKDIEEQPTVDAEPVRHGKWIDMGDYWKCSECMCTQLKKIPTVYGDITLEESKYCPYCGAKMEKDK